LNNLETGAGEIRKDQASMRDETQAMKKDMLLRKDIGEIEEKVKYIAGQGSAKT
jgi:hypothetical protein